MNDDDDFRAGFTEGYHEALADMAALLKRRNPRAVRGIEGVADELAGRLPRPSRLEMMLLADRRRCRERRHAA